MDTEAGLPGTLAEAHAVIRDLRAVVQALQERVADLEARLGQNSANSSRPPSSDPPSAPPPAKRPPSGRKPGGQPGHVAHQRALLPPEQVDRLVVAWPERRRRCGLPLPRAPEWLAAPERHQVSELPPVRVEVTEYRLQRVRCPCCGAQTRAGLPPGVPAGAFGPRLQAAVAVLSGRYRLSRRSVAGALADLVGASIALGSVDGLCRATSAALAQPVAELAQAVRAAPVANADETSWRQAGKPCWLWVVVTGAATLFAIAKGRGGDVLKGLLGEEFAGVVTSDRWTAYLWLGALRRQLCWAHLTRDFQGLADRGGAARAVGQPALDLVARLFAAWHTARDDPAARARLPEAMRPIQAEFRALLETGQASPSAKAASLCRALLALWPALWTFVTVPGVAPTNNAAERAVRPAVLWRKQSLGTQTDAGNQFVARMLSVATTCQQQQRGLLDYLTTVCVAALHGGAIPSLLPTSATP
jgi:transposase